MMYRFEGDLIFRYSTGRSGGDKKYKKSCVFDFSQLFLFTLKITIFETKIIRFPFKQRHFSRTWKWKMKTSLQNTFKHWTATMLNFHLNQVAVMGSNTSPKNMKMKNENKSVGHFRTLNCDKIQSPTQIADSFLQISFTISISLSDQLAYSSNPYHYSSICSYNSSNVHIHGTTPYRSSSVYVPFSV